MRSKFALRILFGLALGLLLAACGSSTTPNSSAPTVNLSALDTFKYDPTSLTGKVGQPIHVVITNKGTLAHSFVVDELSVKLENIQGGAAAETTFTPAAAGTYVFYCDTPGHKPAGMTGTLVVSP